MGQPQKITADWFPFYVRDGRTLFALQQKYGLAGIGFFTQVFRLLGQTPGHYYTLADEYDRQRFLQFCGTSESECRAMLTEMAKTGKIDRALWDDHEIIWSDEYVESLHELYRKRKAGVPTREAMLKHLGIEGANQGEDVPQDSANPAEDSGNMPETREDNTGHNNTNSTEQDTSPAAPVVVAQNVEVSPAGEEVELSPLKDAAANAWQNELLPRAPWTKSKIPIHRNQCNNLGKYSRALVTRLPPAAVEALKELGHGSVWVGIVRVVLHALAVAKKRERDSPRTFWRGTPETPQGIIEKWERLQQLVLDEWAAAAERGASSRLARKVFG